MIDQFHRDFLSSDLARWVNKSPGSKTVQLAPILAEIFPRSQFIFMKRSAITTVNSTLNYISKVSDMEAFRVTCANWVRVMRTWRQVRHLLAGRYLEVSQEDIAKNPSAVASRVAEFLKVPQLADDFAYVFRSKRENTAFPDKNVGEYIYPVNWPHEQRTVLTDICGEEMAVWGYPLDFENPEGIGAGQVITRDDVELEDMMGYYRWISHVLGPNEKEELIQCKEMLARINEGRVMRVLNWLNRTLHQSER
jgi:hypothetical protein